MALFERMLSNVENLEVKASLLSLASSILNRTIHDGFLHVLNGTMRNSNGPVFDVKDSKPCK